MSGVQISTQYRSGWNAAVKAILKIISQTKDHKRAVALIENLSPELDGISVDHSIPDEE